MDTTTRGPARIIIPAVLLALTSLAIFLRIWSRLTSKAHGFWWDDWSAIATLPFIIALSALSFKWDSKGYGHHVSQIPLDDLSEGLKYLYALTLIFDIAITLPKYSALFFYARVFRAGSKKFRTCLWVVGALITAWFLYAFISVIFECSPIRKAWLPTASGHCVDSYKWYFAAALSSVIIDLLIFLLPLPIIWTLHTGRSRKIILTGMFFCGYCAITVSLGRLVSIVQAGETLTKDITWNTAPYFLWASCEGPVSVISVSLPNIVNLARRAYRHGFGSLFTRREYVPSSGSRGNPTPGYTPPYLGKRGFERIGNDRTHVRTAADTHMGHSDVVTPADYCREEQEPIELTRLQST